uniref:DNA-directed RNA polymerase subunit beta n=1 Tax=Anthurium amnicola TaxID=1678845 RepID=A0A1D1XHF8_9ARAE
MQLPEHTQPTCPEILYTLARGTTCTTLASLCVPIAPPNGTSGSSSCPHGPQRVETTGIVSEKISTALQDATSTAVVPTYYSCFHEHKLSYFDQQDPSLGK